MLFINKLEGSFSVTNVLSRRKILNYLGLCRRAGFIISGSELLIKALLKKQLFLVVIASDASPKTTKEIKKHIVDKIFIINQLSSSEISQAIGQERKVLGVTDQGIAQQIRKIIEGGE